MRFGVLLAVPFLAAGCAEHKAAGHGPLVAGYVNLDKIAPMSPEWARVTTYDRLLSAITIARTQDRVSGATIPSEPESQTLPSLAPPPEMTTDLALEKERERLGGVSEREVAELTARLDEARVNQLRVESRSWRMEAATVVAERRQAIDTDYANRLDTALRADSARLFNLQMRVNALGALTQRWALSTPPAPLLAAANRDLIASTAELADADTGRNDGLAKLGAEHRAALASAAAEGDAYVASRQDQQDALLRSADVQRVALARTGLRTGMNKLLGEVAAAESRVWIKPTAPGVETVPFAWPRVGAAAAQADAVSRMDEAAQNASIDKTRDRLIADRNRWLQYAYDRARSAVLDLASARHWQLSFTRSRQYDRDVTPQVVSALSAPS